MSDLPNVTITVPNDFSGARIFAAVAAEMFTQHTTDKAEVEGATKAIAKAKKEVEASVDLEPEAKASSPVEKPKRKRRTNAEIAADEAKEKAAAKQAPAEDLVTDPLAAEPEFEGMGDPLPEIEEDVIDIGEMKKTPAYTLEGDVIPAIQTYVKKSPANKEKVYGMFRQMGIKSVRDIPANRFNEVMGQIQWIG